MVHALRTASEAAARKGGGRGGETRDDWASAGKAPRRMPPLQAIVRFPGQDAQGGHDQIVKAGAPAAERGPFHCRLRPRGWRPPHRQQGYEVAGTQRFWPSGGRAPGDAKAPGHGPPFLSRTDQIAFASFAATEAQRLVSDDDRLGRMPPQHAEKVHVGFPC